VVVVLEASQPKCCLCFSLHLSEALSQHHSLNLSDISKKHKIRSSYLCNFLHSTHN
jgi:hypothetical protein